MQHELKVKEMDRVLEMKKLDYNHEEAIQVCIAQSSFVAFQKEVMIFKAMKLELEAKKNKPVSILKP